jgi:nitroreductase
MNSFFELITQRRSIRKFTGEPIAPEQVELILKAGLKSPSSKNAKPCHFYPIEDKTLLEKLSYCKKQGGKLIAEVPFIIVVAADTSVSSVWIEDASVASIMMQLQAEDLGLGSCWVQIRERYTEDGLPSDEYVQEVLELPSQMQVLSIIVFGHKGQRRPPIDDDSLDWGKVHIMN